jgi:hypothetical protein
MSHWQKCHSQLFNIAGRFVGAWFVLGGVIFIIYGVTNGGALYVVPGLVVAVLGILLICARPYRPDLRGSDRPGDVYTNPNDFFAIEQRIERLYDEGRRLFLQGKHEEALERFKRIYEDKTVFRDVAEIVEDYYAHGEDAWIAKYQPRFERQSGVAS